MEEVTIRIPLALQQLIVRNNQLLKNYQSELKEEIEAASLQMMQILRLDPDSGWKLDIEKMRFVRSKTDEEKKAEEIASAETPSTE